MGATSFADQNTNPATTKNPNKALVILEGHPPIDPNDPYKIVWSKHY